jgi:DNA-binding transcriptional MerR regulator/methylmalonyl-CoA mutase cobalamin-binding subunit
MYWTDVSSGYPIAFIERSTGVSRETLRMWERRYGFPTPVRDGAGDRSYSQADLERLRLIKRLLDQGHRPGKIVPISALELAELDARPHPEAAGTASDFEDFLDLLRQPGAGVARNALHRRMARESLVSFTTGTLAPLTGAVGDAWAAGRLSVHEEHLYTEMIKRVLRRAIDALPAGQGPLIVLTTLPEERHGLGLLMVEALLRSDGASCLNLGVDLPIPEIVLAVEHHRADALALSFSSAYPRRRILPQLETLREQLPPACQVWAGGRVTAKLRSRPGLRFCPELAQASPLLAELKREISNMGEMKHGEPLVEMG